jgi:hypothetical protein
MINQNYSKSNKVFAIIMSVVLALFLLYFGGYQIGKAYYYFTH